MDQFDLLFGFLPDVSPAERQGVEALVRTIEARCRVFRLTPQAAAIRQFFRGRRAAKRAWFVCRDWRTALGVIRARSFPGKIFLSVLDPGAGRTVPGLFLSALERRVPDNVSLVVHSPMSLRFQKEMASIPESQLHYLPLAVPRFSDAPASSRGEVVVGTMCSFARDSNLHYFLTVAHYVARRSESIRFRLIGNGPLRRHVGTMIEDLGLSGRVDVANEESIEAIRSLDVFLYVALQNAHFLPLLSAAAAGLPLICNDIPGIWEFVEDSQNSFVVPTHETKPMGELVLRFASSQTLRQSIGGKLQETLSTRFSPERVAEQYLGVFLGWQTAKERAA